MHVDTPAWEAKASCKDFDPGLWFPERRAGSANHGTEAKEICGACPVMARCLDAAIVRREKTGIWGGCGESNLRMFRRLRSVRPHPEPGPVEHCRCGYCKAFRAHVVRLRNGVQDPARGPAVNANGPNARHGLRVTYTRGCRCPACTWSATKLGQALARLGVNTADHWLSCAPTDRSYPVARLAADDAARALIEPAVRQLLAYLGLVDATSVPLKVGGGPLAKHSEEALELELVKAG